MGLFQSSQANLNGSMRPQKVVFKVGEQELDTEWMVIKLPFIT